MVTLNICADIEPTPKIQSMLRVAPALRGKPSSGRGSTRTAPGVPRSRQGYRR